MIFCKYILHLNDMIPSTHKNEFLDGTMFLIGAARISIHDVNIFINMKIFHYNAYETSLNKSQMISTRCLGPMLDILGRRGAVP